MNYLDRALLGLLCLRQTAHLQSLDVKSLHQPKIEMLFSIGSLAHDLGETLEPVTASFSMLKEQGLIQAHKQNPALHIVTDLGQLEINPYRTARRIPELTRKLVLARDGSRCANPCCAERNGLAMALSATEYDHRHPWALGGTNHPDNIQLMCVVCNRRKSRMSMNQFVRLEQGKVDRGERENPLQHASTKDLLSLASHVQELLKVEARV